MTATSSASRSPAPTSRPSQPLRSTTTRAGAVQVGALRVLSGMTERASSADACARAAPHARGVVSWPPRPPPPLTSDRSARTRQIPTAWAASAGSWPGLWRPGSSPPCFSSPPRSSRCRRMPSPARCCGGSLWVGRLWPCSRYGSPTSHSVGPCCRRCSWARPDFSLLHSVRASAMPCAGCGRRRYSRWRSGWPYRPTGDCAAVMALASVSAGFETVREHQDASAYPMSGQLINVGGHRLHLQCTGSGSPTVVLQPGGGDMSSAMGWIAPAVAGHTRVCVYDSAGRGWSDPSDATQDGAQMMTDLHTLLHRGHVPGPYVLAGHSFGGLYVRVFAAQYPDEVAGMVLIDSTGAHLPASTSAQSWGPDDILARASVLASTSARLGVGRLLGLGYGSLPPQ